MAGKSPRLAGRDNGGLSASSQTLGAEPRGGVRGSGEFILSDGASTASWRDAAKTAIPWTRSRAAKLFTKKTLHRRLPVSAWLPSYDAEKAVGDAIAGITVGLTVIPQSLAYASIAGLPPQYGLYGSFLGAFAYIFLGSCKDVPMGPTAIASLMTYQTVGSRGFGIEHAVLLAFLVGVVEILMGVLGLGFLIDFVSGPVSSGFTSAVALIILTSQMKDVLGISVTGSTFLQQWVSIFGGIGDSRVWDATLGAVCIVVLLLMRVVGMVKIGPADEAQRTTKHRIVNRALWTFGATRNAIVVIACGALGYSFARGDAEPPMRLIGHIPPGMPPFAPPPFSYERNNATFGFLDMCSDLGSGLVVVPLIGLLENIAICKAFANGKTIDATQELLAMGASNVANSFVLAYPVTGSVARAAVNHASGVRTPLGGLYTGTLVILSLLFFTPHFAYIPKSSLAAVIIAAVVFMIEVHVVKPMWRSKKSDLIPGMGTFAFCLVLPLEVGILLGIGLNVAFILYHAARPKISVETLTSRAGEQYLTLTPDRCLIFPSVDYVRRLVTKHSLRRPVPVVIDCTHVYGADYTAARVVQSIGADFRARDQTLFLYNLKPSVCAIFEGLGPTDFSVFYDFDEIDRLLKERSGDSPRRLDAV